MTIYNVIMEITGTARIAVEAKNEDDAEEKAKDAIEDGEGEIDYEIAAVWEICKQ